MDLIIFDLQFDYIWRNEVEFLTLLNGLVVSANATAHFLFMNKISFIFPSQEEMKNRIGVYKITINEQWFYYGSSANLQTRFFAWKHRIMKQEPQNQNIRFLLPIINTVKFEVIEYCQNDTDPKLIEDVYIKTNFGNIDCLNQSPSAFTVVGRRLGFGESVKWKPKGVLSQPKKVAQLDKQGNFIKLYDSLTKASLEIYGSKKEVEGISKNGRGLKKYHRGFVFRFIDDNGELIIPKKFKIKYKTRPAAHLDEFKFKKNKLVQVSKDGLFKIIHPSVLEAANYNKVHRKTIWRYIKAGQKNPTNFLFFYK